MALSTKKQNEQKIVKTSGTLPAMYQHFNQAKEIIQGIEAIDYFFAKEMLNALIFERDHELTSLNAFPTDELVSNLNHTFLALSASLRAGHSCLPISEIAELHWGKSNSRKVVELPSVMSDGSDVTEEQEVALKHQGFVFTGLAELHNMLSELAITENDEQLLVYKDKKLYLRRYFQFESELAKAINLRLDQQSKFNNAEISRCIAALFPQNKEDLSTESLDMQKIAVANAINKSFSVIAGGPGTGKTYTVTKLLAALVMLEQSSISTRQSKLAIALVAPTGKAAQRLSESIINAVAGFKGSINEEILAEIPSQAQTVHRLLGVVPNSPNFKHHQNNQLPFDIVLIDEVSMVDLPLMTRIFRALKPTAKVILLGDADQLPSVAAGSVLADIAPRPHRGFSDNNNDYLSDVCQLPIDKITAAFQPVISSSKANLDYLTFLVKSRRFDGKGGIGLLAKSVISGDVQGSWQLLQLADKDRIEGDSARCALKDKAELSMAQGALSKWLAPLVRAYYQPIESCDNVKQAFSLLSKFRILCATRQGEYGVEQINTLIKSFLGKNNTPYQQNQQILYHGQPIMINENDYRLGLFNGDIGIIWRIVDLSGQSHLVACFECAETQSVGEEGIRHILPSRLPKFESVYAMTIHKTQGSEFSHVAMIISSSKEEQTNNSDKGSKLLSRELLYTGITRSKKQLTVCTNQAIWRQGVTARVQRHSGLTLKPSD